MVQQLQPTSGATWPYDSSSETQFSPIQSSPGFDSTFSFLFPYDVNTNNSFPTSPTSSESSYSTFDSPTYPPSEDFSSFQFVTPTEILFNPYLDQDVDWMTLSFPSSPNSLSSPVQFRFPDVPKTLPTRSAEPATPPSAKRQRTRAASSPIRPAPCPCQYCIPSKPTKTLTSYNPTLSSSPRRSTVSSPRRPVPAPLQSTPLPSTLLKLDLLPPPRIIGQKQPTPELASNEPESDAVIVFKQQQAAIKQARKMMKSSPFPAAVRSRSASAAGKGMDGFDGRPFFGDARTYL